MFLTTVEIAHHLLVSIIMSIPSNFWKNIFLCHWFILIIFHCFRCLFSMPLIYTLYNVHCIYARFLCHWFIFIICHCLMKIRKPKESIAIIYLLSQNSRNRFVPIKKNKSIYKIDYQFLKLPISFNFLLWVITVIKSEYIEKEHHKI